MSNIAVEPSARLRGWFSERELLLRSQGKERRITLTTRMQVIGAGALVAMLFISIAILAAVSVFEQRARADREELLAQQAWVKKAESDVSAYRAELGTLADDLQKRQDFIEQVLPLLPEDVKPDGALPEESGSLEPVTKISASVPEAAALLRLEARQLAFVDNLTRYAEQRAARTEDAIRQLGLDPRTILASAQSAQGGPFEQLATNQDGSTDPRFERLGLSLARMDALERGLQGIPQVMPADMRMISSGFGYRSDPFNGAGAMHAGLDFRGRVGTPIRAAADGKVSFVGTKGGYGKVVEISHGNGMMTRYAHMSAFKAKPGQKVDAGDVIGAIGSTGRSTGPHLHFEVRIKGRAVNPRPFLENAPQLLEDVRSDLAGTDESDTARRG